MECDEGIGEREAQLSYYGAPAMRPKRRREIFMTPAELAIAGESLYGSQWRTPLSKALKVGTRVIRYWERGERRIPEAIAMQIRQVSDIGPIGLIIRSSVRRAAPELSRSQSHQIAIQVLADLSSAGII